MILGFLLIWELIHGEVEKLMNSLEYVNFYFSVSILSFIDGSLQSFEILDLICFN